MAIVSCPECNKKLKVADTSVGKKVKCSCGNIFVAQVEAPAAPAEAAPMAPEKVFVACTECGAKLKVATTSLGKKMKCPKCAGVFVAQIQEETPPPPPEPEIADDDDAPPPMAKPIKKAAADDDDLMAFMDQEDEPTPKGKAKPKKADDEDDDEPKPKVKPGKKPPKMAEGAGGKPVYPSRLLPNILVTFMLLGLAGVFAVMFFGPAIDVDVAKLVGIPPAKGVTRIREFKGGDDGKNKNAKKDDAAKLDGKDKDADKDKDKDKNGDKDKDGDKDDNKGIIEKTSDKQKAVAALLQARVLTKAAQAYYVRNQKFPQSLSQLVEPDDFGTKYIESKNNLLDPWKKPYQYDALGPKNQGATPDIWTVSPTKEVIGNWTEKPPEKKEDDKDEKKNNGKDKVDEKDKSDGKPVALDFSRQQKLEKEWLATLRKSPRDAKVPSALVEFNGLDSVAFSPSTPVLALTDEEGIVLWNLETGKKIKTIPHPSQVISLVKAHFSRDGQLLALLSRSEEQITFFNVASGAKLKTIKREKMEDGAFASDGKHYLFSEGFGRKIGMLRISDWSEVPLPINAKENATFAFAPSGRKILELHSGERIVIHDLETGKQRTVETKEYVPLVMDLQISRDDRFLAFTQFTADQVVGLRLVDLESGQGRWLIEPAKQSLSNAKLTPDDKMVMYTFRVGEKELVKITDIATKKEIHTSPGLHTIHFSPGFVFAPRRTLDAADHLIAVEDLLKTGK